MKAWLLYTLARLGIFAVALVLLLLLTPLKWYWATIIAALVGLLISYIALSGLRTQVALSLANRRGAPERDADSDFEDDFVDAADSDASAAPVVRPVSDADRHEARRDTEAD
ncbi:DUF4229 domain-containing protein [Curtobacterium aurantiacum]|uniref:DUF4229 domain-containing protein n=1 Tax=Curtobacterium aurantiacum TaxID=3236919 RepID=A0ABS5VH25_9MICO|nr:DUF4229 domain-containing protein [Curtobacterium flaccumfaciens]MBT1546361.1 DUF4229 domain-containing protein [Curtobacterium flaccumfaciens pv. flaccumfaciens]MBT1588768.1 DUF4229 domain-containing protein [Curtobacterium flaccumfaciens pv. flaccumfaciens]